MKKNFLRLIALVLACLLLAGCDLSRYTQALDAAYGMADTDMVAYEDMVYTRVEMTEVENSLALACETAAGEDLPQIIRQIYAFYDVYDRFYTNYSLADLRYSADLTDSYWQGECDYFAANSPRVDAALEELYYALAQSPCLEELEGEDYFGAGYFDSYQGENNWDAAFVTLMEEESALISRYYALSEVGSSYDSTSQAYYDACGEEMAQLLVELVKKRHEIAAYWGYEDYTQFATDFYYYRDYSVADSQEYLEDIRRELVELYRQVNRSGIWDTTFRPSNEARTMEYVREMSRNMGGTIQEAFQLMEQAGLYDISYGANKYPSSFEVYLTSYYEPFIFLCPTQSNYDHLTFAHEFGHFCNDYASYGSYAGVDVLEVFSQGMEYLSLCYVEDSGDLTELKMADSLCLYVEQSAYASFEMQLYDLPVEELTVENLIALYDKVALDYGFDSIGYNPWEFVTVTHYYTNPMYILSYVVSNDAALQLYQLEQAQPGAGLELYEKNLTTGEYYFLSFLEGAGLQSPFAPGRIQSVRETFEAVFGK